MTVRTELTPAEAADRLALRELFDAYAHCADGRDAVREYSRADLRMQSFGVTGTAGRRAPGKARLCRPGDAS